MNDANGAMGNKDQSTPTGDAQGKKAQMNKFDHLAAMVIGIYLVVHSVVLSLIAMTAWLASDCSSWFLFSPLHLPCPKSMSPGMSADFQRLVISGCMAGLGGAVYVVQRFSVGYAYGYTVNEKGQVFQARETARYLLVALSSVILGPIIMALARAGAITFTGSAAGKQMPILTLVGFSFLMGFSYHDTLKALERLSAKILDLIAPKERKDDKSKKPVTSDNLANAKGAGA